MADKPLTPTSQPPDDMHWGFTYLREDLLDVRQDIRRLDDRIVRLDDRIERSEARLAGQIRWVLGIVVIMWVSMVGMITPLLLKL
ncbi:MAG TPA: hypothetical protein QGF95_18885 [Candidatus Latescibacteria bacterium]|jgi:hypothetical protein|nr:hypothetical protein [Gemmatimonadaceae bacterium]MDP6016595.1 hypothetical protein [Candidatus Latescibacterota bacterium]HJP32615.1 hypothetical protein [Candidatus Latescibacterota bacterium]|tara:strand:+ start:140 stop:394 length:255 start_codon:yes stop_codon:yes gene_type:complete